MKITHHIKSCNYISFENWLPLLMWPTGAGEPKRHRLQLRWTVWNTNSDCLKTVGRRLQQAVSEPDVLHLRDVNYNVTTTTGRLNTKESGSSAFILYWSPQWFTGINRFSQTVFFM